MRRAAIVAGVISLTLAAGACSAEGGDTPSASSVPPNDMPACEEVYVEGDVISRDNFGKACVLDGEIVSPRPVRLECTDGSELLFNDLAWGYWDEPMKLTPADDPSKMPESEVDSCLDPGAPGATSTTTTIPEIS